MVDAEFKDLLHNVARAIGIANKHPDPHGYAISVVDAHESVVRDAQPPESNGEVIEGTGETPAAE